MTIVIDRRHLLRAMGGAAVTAPFAGLARAAASTADHSLDGLMQTFRDAIDAGAKLETLHRISDQHRGFSYYAGLPGHLGMPFPDLARWFATDGANVAWLNLQMLCDVRCLIVGSTNSGDGNAACGGPGEVSRALSAASVRRADLQSQSITPYGATLALTMPQQTWTGLSKVEQSTMIADAARMTGIHIAHHTSALAALPKTQAAVVDRISEAVTADLANHDALTRRINSHYFAFRSAYAGLRSKNVV